MRRDIARPAHGTGALTGVEAVIDKDLAAELLAEDVAADLFIMATDVDGGLGLGQDHPGPTTSAVRVVNGAVRVVNGAVLVVDGGEQRGVRADQRGTLG